MPINAGPEYFKAEEKYLRARTKEEKMEAVEEMIRALPKHKYFRDAPYFLAVRETKSQKLT